MSSRSVPSWNILNKPNQAKKPQQGQKILARRWIRWLVDWHLTMQSKSRFVPIVNLIDSSNQNCSVKWFFIQKMDIILSKKDFFTIVHGSTTRMLNLDSKQERPVQFFAGFLRFFRTDHGSKWSCLRPVDTWLVWWSIARCTSCWELDFSILV